MSISQALAPNSPSAQILPTDIGQRLRRIRLSRNLTQGEMSQGMFSVSYISGIERGRIRPSLGALERIARLLHIPVNQLLTDNDSQPLSPQSRFYLHESSSREPSTIIERSLQEAAILQRQSRSTEAINVLMQLNRHDLTARDSATLDLYLASCYRDQGRAEEARQAAQNGIKAAEYAGEGDLADRLRAELAQAYSLLHCQDLAITLYQQILQALQDSPSIDLAFHLRLLLALGDAYASVGRHDESLTVLVQAATVAEEVSNPEQLASYYWDIYQARTSSKRDTAEAKDAALRTLSCLETARHNNLVIQTFILLGRVLVAEGQIDKGRAQLQQAYDMACGLRNPRGIAEAARYLTSVYLLERRFPEAQHTVAVALSAAEQTGDTEELARSTLVLAHIQSASAQDEEAAASFERTIDLFQARQSTTTHRELGKAYADYAEFLEHQGHSTQALSMLKLAYNVLQHEQVLDT